MKKEWKISTFKEVVEIKNGKNQKYVEDPQGMFPIYGSGGVIGYASDFICERGATVIGRKGTINRPLFVESKFWIVDTAFGLVPSPELIPKFFNYFCQSYDFSKHNKGTTIPSLVKADLAHILVPLPPLSEQQRIVGLLDQAFEAIVKAKAHAERNLNNAREIFESYLNSVFTKRGEDWVETRIDKISENSDRQRIPVSKDKRETGKYPYYGASGIVDYVSGYIFEGDALLVSEDGANLVARTTPIAFSVSGKFWVNNHAHVLRFPEIETQKFVEFYLETTSLEDYLTGTAQPKLNQKALNSIPIFLPSNARLLKQVVEGIEQLRAEAQKLEALYQRKLELLEELKKSLLQQAFSGAL